MNTKYVRQSKHFIALTKLMRFNKTSEVRIYMINVYYLSLLPILHANTVQ